MHHHHRRRTDSNLLAAFDLAVDANTERHRCDIDARSSGSTSPYVGDPPVRRRPTEVRAHNRWRCCLMPFLSSSLTARTPSGLACSCCSFYVFVHASLRSGPYQRHKLSVHIMHIHLFTTLSAHCTSHIGTAAAHHLCDCCRRTWYERCAPASTFYAGGMA